METLHSFFALISVTDTYKTCLVSDKLNHSATTQTMLDQAPVSAEHSSLNRISDRVRSVVKDKTGSIPGVQQASIEIVLDEPSGSSGRASTSFTSLDEVSGHVLVTPKHDIALSAIEVAMIGTFVPPSVVELAFR